MLPNGQCTKEQCCQIASIMYFLEYAKQGCTKKYLLIWKNKKIIGSFLLKFFLKTQYRLVLVILFIEIHTRCVLEARKLEPGDTTGAWKRTFI